MTSTRQNSNYRLTYIVLLLGVSAYALLQSLVVPVLSTIQHDLHTSQATVTWVLTAYLLSASIFTPILGRVGDMVGKERMLVATLLALAAGSLLAGLAQSVGVLILARAMAAVGGGAGIVLAGPIVKHLNYHWLFWIPLIICLIAAVCAQLFVPESPVRTPGKISWLAAVLLSAWLVALLIGVSEAPTWGWGSSKVIGLMVLAVIIGVVWVRVELRSREPLIDMHMMRIPAVWTNNLVAFMFGIGMYSVIGFLPQFLQTPKSTGYGYGASIIQSGLYLLPLTVTMFIFGMLSGRIAARFGSKSAVIVGSVFSLVSYLLFAFAHTHPWEIYLASTILGIGLGLAFSAMSNLIVQAVPPAQTGVASGMNANIRTIGGAFGAAVMSSIVTSKLLDSGYPAATGYTRGFAFLAAMTGVAIIAAVFIPTATSEAASADHQHHLQNAELALVPGGTFTEE
jgi:MFS family permease